jgi:lipopolysaccharide export system permease protein
MRLLDRYILRELLTPLGYCLAGFLLFWIVFDLFAELNDFQRARMGPLDIAEYYLVKSPEFLVLVFPIALLLALLYTLTNHSRHHEITAIRAAGISLWRLSLPYFAVGFAASLVVFALNEFQVPDSADVAEQIMLRRTDPEKVVAQRDRARNLGFTNARDGRTWQIGTFNFKTFEMLHPQVDWRLPDGSRRWIFAERAVLTNGVWVFHNVREFEESGEAGSLLIPSVQTNVVAYPEFSESPDEIRSEIKISERLGSVRSARKADIPISEIRDYLRLHPNPSRSDRDWLHTILHGRLAAPWTCIVVVLIALPFGAASGRRNIFVGVASSVVICFAYFILLNVGLALGAGGRMPPWLAAWLPNLTFGLAGIWMTLRVR